MTLANGLLIAYILIAAGALICTAAYILGREKTVFARTLLLLAFYFTVFLLSQMLALNSGRLAELPFWQQFRYFSLPLFPGLWLLINGHGSPDLKKAALRLSFLLLPLLTALFFFSAYLQVRFTYPAVSPLIHLFSLSALQSYSWPLGQLLFFCACLLLTLILSVFSFRSADKKNRAGLYLMLLATVLPLSGLFLDQLTTARWGFAAISAIYPLAWLIWLYGLVKFQSGRMMPLALATVFRTSPEASFILNPEWQIVAFNRAAANLFPALDNGAIGKGIASVMDQEGFMFNQLFAEKESAFSLRRAGEERFFIASLDALPSQKGQEEGLIITLRETTRAVLAEEALKSSQQLAEQQTAAEKERFQTAFLGIQDGLIVLDGNHRVTLLNQTAETMTGWPLAEAQSRPLTDIFPLRDEETGGDYGRLSGKADTRALLVTRDGVEIPIECGVRPLSPGEGQGMLIVFRDGRNFSEKDQRIAYLSDHDPLTGLFNRRYLQEEMLRLDRPANLPLSVAIFDINGLKLINDAMGHQAGDQLLEKAGAALQRECRGNDVAARVGGDEFVLLLPKTQPELAKKIVQRIENAIASEKVNGLPLHVCSGLASKNTDQENLDKVRRLAEDDLYRLKLSQRNQVRQQIIQTLIQSLYEKSAYEREHSAKVSHYALALALALNLEEGDLSAISRVGLVHDIGKIRIDSQILNATEPLDEAQMWEIRRHAESGYRILSSVPEFSTLADDVLYHHERWDGSGYPSGLREREIPLKARILAVADAFAAMTSSRPYRPARSHAQARAELCLGAGSQFDPELVAAFLELPETAAATNPTSESA